MKAKLIVTTVALLFIFCSANAFAKDWGYYHNKKKEIIHKIYNKWQNKFCPPSEPEPEPEPPASSPSIKVFDADGQNLGNFVYRTTFYYETFLPEVGKVIQFRKFDGGVVSLYYDTVYFENGDCTGNDAFVDSFDNYDIISGNEYGYLPPQFDYISVNFEAEPVTVYSQWINGTCQPRNGFAVDKYRIINIDEGSFPFSVPAGVPLQMKYE